MSIRKNKAKPGRSRLRMALPAAAMAITLPLLAACSDDADNSAAEKSSQVSEEFQKELDKAKGSNDSAATKPQIKIGNDPAEDAQLQAELQESLDGIQQDLDNKLSGEHPVTFRATGDLKDASINYFLGNSGSKRESGVNGEWTKEEVYIGVGGPALHVVNGIEGNGDITCQIIQEGKVISENTATGALATANCITTPTP